MLCYLEEMDNVAVQDRVTDVSRVTALADCYADMLLESLPIVPAYQLRTMLAGTMLSFLTEVLQGCEDGDR